MPLTQQEAQKIGQAIANQLFSVLGSAPEQPTMGGRYDGAEKYKESLQAIEADFKDEVVPAVKDMVARLRSSGYVPAGKSLDDVVIVVA